MYSPEAVAHIVIGMHLSFTQYDTSSTISSKTSGNTSLAAGTTPEVAMCRYVNSVSFDFGQADFPTNNSFHECIVIAKYGLCESTVYQ